MAVPLMEEETSLSVGKIATMATRKKCEHPEHVVQHLDSAGNGTCVCGNVRTFGAPVHGRNVWYSLTWKAGLP